MKKLTILTFLIVINTTSLAEWVQVNKSPDGSVIGYIERDNFKRFDGTVTYSLLSDVLIPKAGRPPHSLVMDIEVNCDLQESRFLRYRTYTGSMATGQESYGPSLISDQSAWRKFDKDKLSKDTCSPKFLDMMDTQKFAAAYDRGDYASGLAGLEGMAQRGSTEAQIRLGDLYSFGRGNQKKDTRAAARWYEKAASQGDETGRDRLTKLQAEEEKQARESREKNTQSIKNFFGTALEVIGTIAIGAFVVIGAAGGGGISASSSNETPSFASGGNAAHVGSPSDINAAQNKSSFQTRDSFGSLVNSNDSYQTKDSHGNLVNSRESFQTRDSFGNLVNSKSCFQTKDSFGNLVMSPGC